MAAAADQPVDGLPRSRSDDEHEEGALAQRGQVLGLAVAVVVLGVGGPRRHAHREQRQQRRDEVGGRVRGLREQAQRAGDEARDELDRDQERGRDDAERRCARAGVGVGALRGSQ